MSQNNIITNLRFILIFIFSLILIKDCHSLTNSYIIEEDKIDPTHFYNATLIQALDKSTATTQIIELSTDREVKFGNISIKLHKCWQAPLSQIPESKALIEVIENNKNDLDSNLNNIFYGWMFASSPSLSSLQHPIYDLTILKCINK
jgi:hypothetical protein